MYTKARVAEGPTQGSCQASWPLTSPPTIWWQSQPLQELVSHTADLEVQDSTMGWLSQLQQPEHASVIEANGCLTPWPAPGFCAHICAPGACCVDMYLYASM